MSSLKRIVRRTFGSDSHGTFNLGLLIALLLLLVWFSFAAPNFLSLASMANIARLVSEVGMVSIGMLLIVLLGGIDLSVGAMMALSGVVAGLAVQSGYSVTAAVILALLAGIVAGTLNGLIVSRAGIPSIIVTLGSMAVYRGVALGLSGGNSFAMPESMLWLGQADLIGIPVQFWLFLALAIVALWVLRRMTAGLTLFAIGNNETASRMAGLSVERAKTLVYTACGGLSALAGLVFAARVSSAKADFGVGLELDAITVVVLSGASLAGGSANVSGLVLGLLTIGVIRMGLSMLFVPSEIQAILIGLVLIVAVASGRLSANLKEALKLRVASGHRAV